MAHADKQQERLSVGACGGASQRQKEGPDLGSPATVRALAIRVFCRVCTRSCPLPHSGLSAAVETDEGYQAAVCRGTAGRASPVHGPDSGGQRGLLGWCLAFFQLQKPDLAASVAQGSDGDGEGHR